MDAFTKHTGKVVPYDMPNVDTDQIIPARFLKKIDRVGFGELLFYELRYEEGRLAQARLHPEPAAVRRRHRPRERAPVRHRLVP